jgi:hypothetical protein
MPLDDEAAAQVRRLLELNVKYPYPSPIEPWLGAACIPYLTEAEARLSAMPCSKTVH